MTHMNMSNPLIPYADMLPDHVIADSKNRSMAYITKYALEISLVCTLEWTETGGTLLPSSDLVMMACLK